MKANRVSSDPGKPREPEKVSELKYASRKLGNLMLNCYKPWNIGYP